MKCVLMVKWIVKVPELSRIQQLLPELAEKTRSEPGNLFYSIYRSDADPSVFFLHEGYVDTDAVAAHRNSEHYLRIIAGQINPHLVLREVHTVTQYL